MNDKAKKELIEQFVNNVETAAATVEVIPASASLLNEVLQKQIADDKFVLFAPPNDLNPDLFKEFILNEKVVSIPSKYQLKFTKTSVTDAFCGIASTGSVCVSIAQNLTSAVSMLTQKHIVVLNGSSIVPTRTRSPPSVAG